MTIEHDIRMSDAILTRDQIESVKRSAAEKFGVKQI